MPIEIRIRPGDLRPDASGEAGGSHDPPFRKGKKPMKMNRIWNVLPAFLILAGAHASAEPIERGRPVTGQTIYAGKNVKGEAVLTHRLATSVDLIDMRWQWMRAQVPVSMCTLPGR